MTKQKLTWLIIIISIPITLTITILLKSNLCTAELPSDKKINVKTAKVISKEFSLPIHTSGRLSSKTEMKLSFKIGGIIKDILVDEGQTVRKGQLLAQLDQSEITAQVNRARSGFQKAKRDMERVKRLYADSVATLEQLQDATTGFEIAQSNLNVALFNQKHAAIEASSSGKILKRFAEAGELVSAGMPIFIFGSAGKDWIVRVGVIDRDVIRLQLNDSASVTFDAYPGINFPAHISEIAESADPTSGTFEVELQVTAHNIKLVSGFIAKVAIFPSKKLTSFIIPIEALIEGNGDNGFVFTLDEDNRKVKKIPITIATIIDKQLAVISGLTGVNEVITDGAPYLTDGSQVNVIDSTF